ncbi:aspartate aminotransferase family protein [Massilia cellulosiltytica]|uniref:aspartate aminotransferase family protein n=1 Tax=Massilia cellulosiltytica TaxID=2683234 RepID=UPI0039B4D65C
METGLLERRYRLLGKGAPLFYDTPLHIVRGEGVWLYDADGKRYLDAYNNVPVVGHCHPRVVAALASQAAQLNVHTRYLHENVLDYGERLTATFDASLDMVFFTCTGSEANDLALRIARQRTGAKGIVCSDCTYHGNSTAVDELSTMFRDGATGSPNVRSVPFPQTFRPLHGLEGEALCDAYVAEVARAIAALQEDGTGFAGMLVCPIFANEGLPTIPEGYMRKVAQLVRDAGGLLIFDEVQSGFGRTGHMWGQQMHGVVPDIVTLGKPMGNGHPIGGVVTRAEIGNGFRDSTMYFNTFGGNPVSCAAGLAVLDTIRDEDLVNGARRVGEYVLDGLRALQKRHASIGDVRGSGLFFAVELVEDRAGRVPAPALAGRLVNHMKENGVLISRLGPYNNVLKIRPPLPFSTADADLLLTRLCSSLGALEG